MLWVISQVLLWNTLSFLDKLTKFSLALCGNQKWNYNYNQLYTYFEALFSINSETDEVKNVDKLNQI